MELGGDGGGSSSSKRKDAPADDVSSSGGSDDDLDSEDEELSARAAYERYLPEAVAQVGDAKPSLKDMELKLCLVCRARLTGWVGLLAHAKSFKKKLVVQHRGYHKALVEVIEPESQERGKRVKLAEARVSVLLEHRMNVVWPPVVLLQGVEDLEKVRGLIEEAVIDQVEKVSEGLVVVCKKIPLALTVLRCLKEPCKVLEPCDMERIDPEKRLVNWSAMTLDEATKLMQGVTLDDDRRADDVQAQKLKSWKLEVVHGKASSQETNLQSMLRRREERLTALKQQPPVADESEELKNDMQRKLQLFEKDLEGKEKESAHNVLLRRARSVRQKKEAVAQRQALERALQIERTQTSAKMEEVRREQELQEKKQKESRQKLEQDYEAEELRMIAEHEKELKQLQEATDRETEAALQDFQENMQPRECSVCLEKFSKDQKPAVLVPCGHYKTCIECCLSIWSSGKPTAPAKCPVCRTVIKSKPCEAYV